MPIVLTSRGRICTWRFRIPKALIAHVFPAQGDILPRSTTGPAGSSSLGMAQEIGA